MGESSERLLREEIAKCWDDPLRYVLLAFPWGVKGTPLEDYPEGPDAWQRNQLNDIRDHIINGNEIALRDATTSGHGIGKSAETAWIILWFCSTRPHCAGRITAGTQAQLNSTTWRELSVWHQRAINKHWFKWTATRFYAIESPETWGVTAIAWSETNSDAFAGLHAEDVLVIYDEASAIADVIWEVTEGAMTTPGAFWFVYGNPVRNTGRFRECFRSMRHRWNNRQVDSRTCRMTNKLEIQQWLEDYGEDSDFFRVRVRGEFPRVSESQFISEDVVRDAQARTQDPRVFAHYPLIMGVDVARFGNDQSVITLRQGPKIHYQHAYRGLDTVQVADKARDLYLDSGGVVAICVDGPGVGGGVVDQLNKFRLPVVDVQPAGTAPDPKEFVNVRAWLWGQIKGWLTDADLPPGDRELMDDLTSIEYGYDNKLRIQMESKKDMKKRGVASPDKADSLALTFHPIDSVVRPNRTAHPVRRRGNWAAHT